MRVLYFVGTLHAGGLERFVTRVALRATETRCFTPLVCCLTSKKGIFVDPLRRAGVEVLEAPRGWQRHPVAWEKLRRLLKGTRCDVVHSQVNFSLLQQCLAVRSAGIRSFCVTERNCYDLQHADRWRRILQHRVLMLSGATYSANGNLVARHVARAMATDAARIAVLPNGVPEALGDPQSRATIRQSLGWTSDDVGVGYLSRVDKHKGHLRFLNAVKAARDSGIPIKACCVGDGSFRNECEKVSRQLEIDEIVTWTGVVTNPEDYLQAFDIVCLFSDREGMPNAILEAMAAHRAVIATSVGSSPELLDDGRAGVLLELGPQDRFDEALIRVAADPQLREALGVSAGIRVKQFYSLEHCVERLQAHYADAIH